MTGAPEYSDYAAGQTLLGIVGIVAAALVPLPLVHVVRSHPRGSEGRRRGMAFAWSVSATAGVVAATVTGAVAAMFAPPPIVGAVAASALALFAISPVWGWMQDELFVALIGDGSPAAAGYQRLAKGPVQVAANIDAERRWAV